MLKRFLQAREANVVVLFGLALVPLLGFVGASLDFGRVAAMRTAMQAALDSTALALSREAPNLSPTILQQKAQASFQAQFNHPEVQGITVTASYSSAGGSALTVSGSGTLKTDFLKLLGSGAVSFGSTATVRWGTTKLRVALALDNTGSMADNNKMTALKTATHQLLGTLKAAASAAGDVQVALVPFSKDVNVGTGNVNGSWIDWTDWNAANTTTTTNYVDLGGGKWCWGGWLWNGSTLTNVGSCSTTPNHSTWNGCITDRTQSYDTVNTVPATATPATLFPAEQYSSCPVPIMGQTYDWTALNDRVDQMTPNGNTNQGIGLAWAWQALTDGAPLNPPAITDPVNTQKVLLSDGLNTQNRWYTNQAQIDARQQTTRKNVKAAEIIMYTVQVNTSGDPTSTLLQNCASDPSKFFLLTSSNQIVAAFNQIGTSIAKLRVAN
jgi:Flp pilus assembly protein TadG